MKKEKQSAQVSASAATAKDVAQVISEQTKLPENGKSQTNKAEGESELKGNLVNFAESLKLTIDRYALSVLKGMLSTEIFGDGKGYSQSEISFAKSMWQFAKNRTDCGLDDETIKKQFANVYQICELKRIYSQIDESTDKASATPEELKIKVNKKVFSIAARKDSDGTFEFVEANETDTLLRAFKGSLAVWTQKSLEAKKMAEVRKMTAENFKQSKRKEYNNWIAEREARGLSTDKSFNDWFALNYE